MKKQQNPQDLHKDPCFFQLSRSIEEISRNDTNEKEHNVNNSRISHTRERVPAKLKRLLPFGQKGFSN